MSTVSDIDQRILDLGLSPELSEKIQALQDTAADEATGIMQEELDAKSAAMERLTAIYKSLVESNIVTHRTLKRQIVFRRSAEDFLASLYHSKNPLKRLLYRLGTWSAPEDGNYFRAKYDVTSRILMEQARQDEKFGAGRHLPNGTGEEFFFPAGLAEHFKELTDRAAKDGTLTWQHILMEEVYEAMAETNPRRLKEELIQVAAVAASWVVDLNSQKK